MTAWEALASFLNGICFTGTSCANIRNMVKVHMPLWEASVEEVWAWSAYNKLNNVCDDTVESQCKGEGKEALAKVCLITLRKEEHKHDECWNCEYQRPQ